MGQLERYGLYVLCVVIFLILGVALWGGDPAVLPTTPSTALEVSRNQVQVPTPSPERDDVVERLRREFSTTSVRNPAPPTLEASLPLAGVRDAGVVAAEGDLRATQPVPNAVPAPTAPREYEVRKDDVLETIAASQLGAAKYWRDILAVNPGLVPTRLVPGTKIKLPSITRTTATPAVPAVSAGKDIHVVQKDDVLEAIALRYLGKASRWREIVAMNPGLDPRRLQLGMQLKLPSRDPASSGR